MHRIVAVTAGLSVPSSTRNLSDQLLGATVSAITARGEAATADTIELRELAVDLAHAFTSPGYSSPALQAATASATEADALIVVTPIFKASYSGLFKMFFDALDNKSLVDKPVLMGATAGSARHSLALEHAVRPLFSYLRARTIPTAVFAATEDFGAPELGERIERAAQELATSLVAEQTTVGGLGGAYARGGQDVSEQPESSDISFANMVQKYN